MTTSSQYVNAEAEVRNAEAGLVSAQRQFEAAQASLRQAEANDLKAQDDVNRYRPLAMKQEIAQQQYTQAVDTEHATAAAVESSRRSAEATEQGITQARARLEQAHAQVKSALTVRNRFPRSNPVPARRRRKRSAPKQQLEQAELNLQYATIVAPVSGVVGAAIGSTRPKRLSGPAVDDHRSAGQPEHLGHGQFQGNAIDIHAARPAGKHLRGYLRPYLRRAMF